MPVLRERDAQRQEPPKHQSGKPPHRSTIRCPSCVSPAAPESQPGRGSGPSLVSVSSSTGPRLFRQPAAQNRVLPPEPTPARQAYAELENQRNVERNRGQCAVEPGAGPRDSRIERQRGSIVSARDTPTCGNPPR